MGAAVAPVVRFGSPHPLLTVRRLCAGGWEGLCSTWKALLELDPGRVERFGIEVFDVMQRLRQELDGDREFDVLGDRQRNLFARRAVEIAPVTSLSMTKTAGRRWWCDFSIAPGPMLTERTRIASSS